MELNFTFDAGNRLVRATLSGHFSLSDAETTFMKVLDALVQHQAKKVLIDGRAITGEPEPMERFYYGEFVADAVADLNKRGVSHVPKFAYVLVEPVLDPERFGETVAVNRGMSVKAFDNLGEAEEWLLITPSAAALHSPDTQGD
jgi:hypothetical protein